MDSTDRKIVFNHFYGLRHDLKRSYIYSREGNLLPVDGQVNIRVNEYWATKLLQKSEMRKVIVIELSYKGFS